MRRLVIVVGRRCGVVAGNVHLRFAKQRPAQSEESPGDWLLFAPCLESNKNWEYIQ